MAPALVHVRFGEVAISLTVCGPMLHQLEVLDTSWLHSEGPKMLTSPDRYSVCMVKLILLSNSSKMCCQA